MSKVDPLAGVNLLDLAPVRVASWEEKEERVIFMNSFSTSARHIPS